MVDEIKTFTSAKIQSFLKNSDSTVKASLARLRHGIGHAPGSVPELWGEYLLDLPESLMGQNGPSYAEWSIYVTLTTFALHQQGRDCKTDPMHRSGISLGMAANQLLESEEDRERVARRFNAVAVAGDMKALSYHLRNLVTLLRDKGVPMDYVRLAADLYLFQIPEMVDKIRLRWGEDFYRAVKNHDNKED